MKELSLKARIYLSGTILVGLILFVYNMMRIDVESPWMLLVLTILATLAIIFKVEGSTNRSNYNFSFLVYSFTFVLLGTPEAMVVIMISNVVAWIWHKYPWYIQSFNITCFVISLQCADLIYQTTNPGGFISSWQGIAGVISAMVAYTMVNHFMVGIIVWLARGENFAKSGIFGFFPLMIDLALMSMGACLALVWTINPYATILIIIPLYLIYSTLKVPALERQTETEPKTGLFNARYFESALANEVARANRFDRPLAVVMADMDLLRNINNTYGHLAGDEVLNGVAKILKESAREYDIVARFGGEEFAILMPETTPEQAFSCVEIIREAIASAEISVPTSVTPIRITMSFGIAGREEGDQSPKDLLHNADAALYHAKLKGRNRTYIYANETYEALFQARTANVQVQEEASDGSAKQTIQRPTESIPRTEKEHVNKPLPEQQATVRDQTVKRRHQQLVQLFIAGVVFAAITLFALSFNPPIDIDWFALICFAVIVFLAEWFSVDIYIRNTAVSTSAAPMLGGALLFGPVGAAVMSLSFATAAFIKHRSPLSRWVFNVGNQLLAAMLCLYLIQIFELPFAEWPRIIQFIVTPVFATLIFMCTTVLVSIAIHLSLGLKVKEVWREHFGWLLPYYVAMGVISYGLVFSYNTAGILGTLVILVPLLLLRLGQKQYIDRTSAVVSELKQKNVTLEKTSQEITRLNNGLLETLAEVVDLRDPYVLGHSRQVTQYAVFIAEKLGLQPGQIELIRKAGLLHDIGKLGVPESILLKPKKLTPEEYRISREHVSLGADILRNSPPLQPLIPIVLHHHERYDGTGYPEGLRGEDIPIEARIIGVADAVEAMASDRPYRRALTPQEILEELRKNTGTQFDPMVVNAFLKILDEKGLTLVVNSAQGEVKNKKSHSRLPDLGILEALSQSALSNNGSNRSERGGNGSLEISLEPKYIKVPAKKTAPLKQ